MMEKGRTLLLWVLVFVLAAGGACEEDKNSGNQNYSKLIKFSEVNNLGDWEAPLEYQKMFGYYLSGFDEECRPIWIGEIGQWDVRKYVLQGKESQKILRKYIQQGAERVMESVNFNNSNCDVRPTQIIAIVDTENFQYSQAASLQTIEFFLDTLKDYIQILLKYVHNSYIVNTNFIAEGFVLIARPILGEYMERVEVYGTRKSEWLPQLLKKLPSDQLPPRFGGSPNFQPIKSYG